MNTFYDINPFYYGYSSIDSIVKNMNPLLKDLIKKKIQIKLFVILDVDVEEIYFTLVNILNMLLELI